MTRAQDTNAAFAVTQRNRKALKDSVRALSARIQSPGELAQSLGRSTRSGVSRAGETLRTHPLPCAMTAVGLVWLVTGARKPVYEPPTTRALSRWEDEGGPPLPPEADAAQIHDPDLAASGLPALALGAGALAVGALMSDRLRQRDPLRGKAGKTAASRLVEDEVTTALNEAEAAFGRLIGGIGNGLIDQARDAVDRFLTEASRTVEAMSQPPATNARAPDDRP